MWQIVLAWGSSRLQLNAMCPSFKFIIFEFKIYQITSVWGSKSSNQRCPRILPKSLKLTCSSSPYSRSPSLFAQPKWVNAQYPQIFPPSHPVFSLGDIRVHEYLSLSHGFPKHSFTLRALSSLVLQLFWNCLLAICWGNDASLIAIFAWLRNYSLRYGAWPKPLRTIFYSFSPFSEDQLRCIFLNGYLF